MSAIFCCPGSSPVTILVQPSDDPVLASASPQFLNGGVDSENGCSVFSSLPFMTGLLGEPQNEISIIRINTSQSWHFGGGIGAEEYDFYSVMLHEFIHSMGIGSRINPDGTTLGNGFSPWDLHLEINGQPLLEKEDAPEGADCCYTYKVNGDLDLPGDIIAASVNGEITVAGVPVCVQTPPTIMQANDFPPLFYNMLSHLDEDCNCLLYTSPSPRDQRGSRMPSSA